MAGTPIYLKDVVNLWKSVSDWVTGATVDTPKVQDDAVKAEIALMKTELAAIRAAQTDGSAKFTLSGNIVQHADLINTDTVIAAGADTLLPLTSITSGRIAVGVRLAQARKFKISVLFYPASSSTYYVKEQIIVDGGSSALVMGAAQVDACTNRVRARIYNSDTTDMTVTLVSFAEVH